MIIFDQVLPKLTEFFQQSSDAAQFRPILVNRDLNGRVCLILDDKWENDPQAHDFLKKMAQQLSVALEPHAYAPDRMILFEPDFNQFWEREIKFPLPGCQNIQVVDRLATEGNWIKITTNITKIPRFVFFSIKGGVGRSTALAATAWALAEQGQRVMVLDLDLEAPGLSSSLLPRDRRPAYGMTDWLVEDLVDNGQAVFSEMVAGSNLSRRGDILVVPAYGVESSDYIAKLGRVWMPKMAHHGQREKWSARLSRLITQLETRWQPDVVLIDCRAGIDEIAAAVITDLDITLLMLFAMDSDQTWDGYRMLFQHWHRSEVIQDIRERLQIIAAMVPELGGMDYLSSLQENAWNLFLETCYDAIPATGQEENMSPWAFDLSDETGPHHPWPIRWHRGFSSVQSLYRCDSLLDAATVETVFGKMIENLSRIVMAGKTLP